MSNNWFQIISDSTLEQGDFFDDIKVIVPTTELLNEEIKEVQTEIHDVIILTQSCDLSNMKTPWIQVTPVIKLSTMQENFEIFKHKKNLETIRRGYQHNYHMINKCEISGYEREICILDFRNIFTLPYQYILDIANQEKPRKRLNSPYKEHLAQAYAKFFMRVGLPNDIPSFR